MPTPEPSAEAYFNSKERSSFLNTVFARETPFEEYILKLRGNKIAEPGIIL